MADIDNNINMIIENYDPNTKVGQEDKKGVVRILNKIWFAWQLFWSQHYCWTEWNFWQDRIEYPKQIFKRWWIKLKWLKKQIQYHQTIAERVKLKWLKKEI